MKNDFDRYFRFLQFSLEQSGGKDFLSGEALADFDWDSFYRFAKKQALVGVVFDGIQKLPKEVAPSQDLLMTWFGQCYRIKVRNAIMNEATAKIYERIKAEGFRCCILKGQGNALMYPNPHARTPGDVDVWVNASREEIRRLATVLDEGNGNIGKESLNHIEMSVDGIAVELHSTPAILNNPLYNRRLQRWLMRNADLQCSNVVELPNGVGGVAVPTAAFNVVYQLFHLYHHYLFEGIGLRQFVDYYFVVNDFWKVKETFSKTHPSSLTLKGGSTFSPSPSSSGSGDVTAPPRCSEPLRSKVGGASKPSPDCLCGVNRLAQSSDAADDAIIATCALDALQRELKHFGLWKFARAVMYVLHEVLGLAEEKMIAPMDKKRGVSLLNEIMRGGNFGNFDERFSWGHDAIGHNVQRLVRDLRLARYYPAEALSEPVFRTWHFLWRMWHK